MSDPQIVTCPVCGKPYEVYSMKVGNQTMCPKCVAAAKLGTQRPDTPEEIERRRKAFGNS